MAKIGPISPARRVWLQVVLCVILVLTVALAAAVTAALDRAAGVDLGPVQEIGSLRFRLPAGWNMDAPQISSGGTLIRAVTGPDQPPARGLQVHHLAVPVPLDCESLLNSQVGMPEDYMVRGGEAQLVRKAQLEVAGITAVLLEGVRVARSAPGEAIFHEIFICAAMPAQKEALLLQMRALRTPDDMLDRGDRLLVRRVAELIELIGPALTPPSE